MGQGRLLWGGQIRDGEVLAHWAVTCLPPLLSPAPWERSGSHPRGFMSPQVWRLTTLPAWTLDSSLNTRLVGPSLGLVFSVSPSSHN